jgi:hypothetical protein
MILIDVKGIKEAARKEIAEEAAKQAVEKLKELYRKKEKAALVLRNIDREIDSYLEDISENITYEDAGVEPISE